MCPMNDELILEYNKCCFDSTETEKVLLLAITTAHYRRRSRRCDQFIQNANIDEDICPKISLIVHILSDIWSG